MDKMQRYELYNSSVGPGWWRILDKYIPKILEADPDCDLYIKEKYGVLRIEMSSSKINQQQMIDWENAAEEESAWVCEFCGKPGRIRRDRAWLQTFCYRCVIAQGNPKKQLEIIQETAKKWLEETEE